MLAVNMPVGHAKGPTGSHSKSMEKFQFTTIRRAVNT